MKVKVSELQGAALDWAVAKCEGRSEPEVVNNFAVSWYTWGNTHYSTDWAQGGPIIEREGISVERRMPCMKDEQWGAQGWKAMQNFHKGPTPLIAAMRCYVASRLGDEIELPEELRA